MTFGAVMISCPDRDAVREQTLESLTESDWADAHVHVEMDKTQFERRQERQEHTALMALQQGQELDADYLLFLEDDLIFNRHLRFNLECWAPLRQKAVSLASLYNPGVRERERCAVESWLVADPDSIFGSQAFILSRALVRYCIGHWWSIPGMQDIKISRLAAQFGHSIYYHTPSLVQHRPGPSVWGGGQHQARDFDGGWKAQP